MFKNVKRIDLTPTQILILGFLGVIFVGTILLNLPIASNDHQSIGFIDALFTSTSAVCVTGLVVVNTLAHWTLFGKIVIIILIQIGGLGFMTFATTLFMFLGKKIGLRERLVIQEALNQNGISGMVRLTRNILIGTFWIEGIGALLLLTRFMRYYSLPDAIWLSIFHSISAFCNAGFDIIGSSSLTPYVHDWLVNITIMLLIILGGLGFTVWMDLLDVTHLKFKKHLNAKHWFWKLSLHTKLVLVLTGTFLVIGFVLYFLLEMGNPDTIGDFSLPEKVLAMMFQAVTPRTAGFNTIDLSQMTDGSKFLTLILMFVGGSPAGTAGGIKTVTIGILFLTVISVVRSKQDTEAFGRRLPEDIIKRSLAVVVISIGVVVLVTIILTVTEDFDFMDTVFEAISAFATVGLTLGVTSKLSIIGKLVIAVTMFIGRLGPMTMAVAFAMRSKKKQVAVRKPEERVMVG